MQTITYSCDFCGEESHEGPFTNTTLRGTLEKKVQGSYPEKVQMTVELHTSFPRINEEKKPDICDDCLLIFVTRIIYERKEGVS